MSYPTPYDRETRLEPTTWRPDPTDHDSYGKVDFDDNEGKTVLTVYVAVDGDGSRTLHVTNHELEHLSIDMPGYDVSVNPE